MRKRVSKIVEELGVDLAKEVVRLCEEDSEVEYAYSLDCSIKEKINDTRYMSCIRCSK